MGAPLFLRSAEEAACRNFIVAGSRTSWCSITKWNSRAGLFPEFGHMGNTLVVSCLGSCS